MHSIEGQDRIFGRPDPGRRVVAPGGIPDIPNTADLTPSEYGANTPSHTYLAFKDRAESNCETLPPHIELRQLVLEHDQCLHGECRTYLAQLVVGSTANLQSCLGPLLTLFVSKFEVSDSTRRNLTAALVSQVDKYLELGWSSSREKGTCIKLFLLLADLEDLATVSRLITGPARWDVLNSSKLIRSPALASATLTMGYGLPPVEQAILMDSLLSSTLDSIVREIADVSVRPDVPWEMKDQYFTRVIESEQFCRRLGIVDVDKFVERALLASRDTHDKINILTSCTNRLNSDPQIREHPRFVRTVEDWIRTLPESLDGMDDVVESWRMGLSQ